MLTRGAVLLAALALVVSGSAATAGTGTGAVAGAPGIGDPLLVYERGGMTLAALRSRIGNDDFARLLKAWTSGHRHGHGATAQFEALASSISGEDLTSFFQAWLVQPVKPALTVANGL